MIRARRLLGLIGLLLAGPAGAEPAVPVEATVQSLDGRQFARFGDWRGSPTLLMFWDVDCPPCLAELRGLAPLAAALPGWQLRTIALADRRRSIARLRDLHVASGAHFAAINPAGLLQRLGNRAGALPYAVALDRHGRACAVHAGLLTAEALVAARRRCA